MGLLAFTLDSEAFVSPKDYLRLERKTIHKHEYIVGKIIAMVGASYAHNHICSNRTVEIGNQLRGKSCSLVGSDLHLQVLNNSTFFYPDLMVEWGKPEFNEVKKPDILLNPTLLVEVLSPSTSQYDRSDKFMLYR